MKILEGDGFAEGGAGATKSSMTAMMAISLIENLRRR